MKMYIELGKVISFTVMVIGLLGGIVAVDRGLPYDGLIITGIVAFFFTGMFSILDGGL